MDDHPIPNMRLRSLSFPPQSLPDLSLGRVGGVGSVVFFQVSRCPTRIILSSQIIATSHDLTPKGS